MDKEKFKNFIIEVKSSNEDKREITAIASVESKKGDRDGDVVHLDGLDLRGYKKAPVVLWSHNSSGLPIGRSKKTWIDGKKLMMNIQFATMEENSFADSVYKMIKSKYINSLSIGFAPNWEKAEYDKDRRGYDFTESTLLEVSIVNVPANAGAQIITRSVEKALTDNVIDDVEKKEFEMYIKELEEDIITDADDETVVINTVDSESFSKFVKRNSSNIKDALEDIESNRDVEIESEQNNDEVGSLKEKISELETRLDKIDKNPSDTEDSLYNWLFDSPDSKVPKGNQTDELIESVLKDLEK